MTATPAAPRRRHHFDLGRTLTLAAVLFLMVVVLAVADLRRRIAALPEIGRATPQYVLDAAEDDAESPPRPREAPETPR